MISVAVYINGGFILGRGAHNIESELGKNTKDETPYRTDCGKIIWHKSEDGAVALAKKLLNCIEEGLDKN